MMVNSSHDMLCLVGDVYTRRATMVIGKVFKRTGSGPDVRIIELLANCRRLHERYEHGDYRHTDVELGRLEAFCQWLLDTAQQLSGNPPKVVTIDRAAMESTEPLGLGTYAALLDKIHSVL